MFKEIFTRLIRHLPSRLVHRDPLPGAQQTVNTAVPPSLSAHCLKMAVMPEEELWKTFDTHHGDGCCAGNLFSPCCSRADSTSA